MEGLKCKNGKVVNKKNNLLIKQQRKAKKRRNSKRKENLKSLKAAPKTCKIKIQKDIGRSRIKDRKGMEGMFFKGLRTEYVTRESLNEANEARKKEDLNRIIDIGRAFFERDRHPVRAVRPVAASTGNGNSFLDFSSDSEANFEQRLLSPIRLTSEECIRDSITKPKEFHLEEEFEKFSLKYEEAAGNRVLERLPEQGVLEDALKALREKRTLRRDELEQRILPLEDIWGEEFKEKEDQFCNEIQHFENFELEVPETEDLMQDIISPRKTLISENFGDFIEKPLDRMLIMTDVKVENYNRPSFTPSFDAESPDILQFLRKGFESPNKDLSITTPPIQFFRRNMF